MDAPAKLSVADLQFDRAIRDLRSTASGQKLTTPTSSTFSGKRWMSWSWCSPSAQAVSSPRASNRPHSKEAQYIVIEGNRRLAAVKLLLKPEAAREQGWGCSQAAQAGACSPSRTAGDRDAQSRGFVALLGLQATSTVPPKWSSYAKAQYIASVHRDYDVPLRRHRSADRESPQTVQRLYRGFMVIEQAERAKVYRARRQVSNTVRLLPSLYGLDYTGISGFLGLTDAHAESTDPVPQDKLRELGELCTWLYGDKRDGRAPLVQRQNLT